MKPVVLIGVGTEDRGDDAIGLRVVRDLDRGRFPFVDVRESLGDGSRLLTLWKDYRAGIIIDAIRSSSPHGMVHRIDLSAHPLPQGFECISSHTFGVSQAVETARILHELPAELLLIGVEAATTRLGVRSYLYDELRERLLGYVQAELERLSPATAGSPY